MTLDTMAAGPDERRHDLDALRAFAMLLGIVLHAAIAFVPGGWAVQDSQASPTLTITLEAIHGFRMQLFFVVSGFFTMMLLRKRGAGGLLKQRALRIALPLLLSVATLAPAVTYATRWAMRLPRTGQGQASGMLFTPLPDIGVVRAYYRMFYSGALSVNLGSWWHIQVFSTPIFHHLWFLWFLCWLTPAFVLAVWLWKLCRLKRLPSWLVLSPANLLWLVPLTLVPEWFMGFPFRPFGPDTSVGLLPMPHILVYYAIFFAFGALYYDAGDRVARAGRAVRLGRYWWLWGGLALGVVFPVTLNIHQGRLLSSLLQVAYAWMMVFALIGFFGRFVRQPNRVIRYLSDASYWLYLMHLPLLIPLQAWVRNWPMPGLLKCALLCIVVTGSLLLVYDLVVRYTWVGAMLNGRKRRPSREPEPTIAAV